MTGTSVVKESKHNSNIKSKKLGALLKKYLTQFEFHVINFMSQIKYCLHTVKQLGILLKILDINYITFIIIANIRHPFEY